MPQRLRHLLKSPSTTRTHKPRCSSARARSHAVFPWIHTRFRRPVCLLTSRWVQRSIQASCMQSCGPKAGLIRGTFRPRTRWDSCRSRRKRGEILRAGSDFLTIGIALFAIPSTTPKWGAAELAGLMRDYRGSLVLIFAGYNAGRGRVEKWIAQYGDPRDPKVDPIDWVERIPFAETRNYVERVLENLQVYRTRFAKGVRAEALRSTEMSANQSRH